MVVVQYEALFWLCVGSEAHGYPSRPKLTLPGASSSSGIRRLEPKTHSCYLVFPRLCVEDTQQGRECLGWPWFMNDKEGKMGERGEGKKKNLIGLIDVIPLETQMCVVILLPRQISKKEPACQK